METVTPYPVFQIGNLIITNTVVNTWIGMLMLIIVILLIKIFKPEAIVEIVEMISSLISGLINVKNPTQYVPFLGSLLIFIFLANNLSFFPGLGSPSQDINTPLTLALLVFVAVHYFGFKEKGVLRYLKDSTSPIIIFPFEVISQISRTVSLTLRLFGNIISTELIVAIISQLVPVGAPILMIALSLLTGTLQAYIFTALAGSYISNAVQQNET